MFGFTAFAETSYAALGGPVFSVYISEAASGVDTVDATPTLVAFVVSTTTGVVYASAFSDVYSNILATASAYSEPYARAFVKSDTSEAASGVDSDVGYLTLPGSVSEAASTFASLQAAQILQTNVFAYAAALDAASARFLWELIDDSQTANWQNISDAQTPSWQTLQTAQTTTWQTIQTPQTPGWGTVDDSQDPGWTDIPTI